MTHAWKEVRALARRKPTIALIAIAVVLALAAGGGLLLASIRMRGAQPGVRFASTLPGAARAGFIQTGTDSVLLQQTIRRLLLKDAGWIRSLRLEGRLADQPSEPSDSLDARDQLAEAQGVLEQGDREALQAALARIRRVFRTGQGLLAASATLAADGRATRSNGFSTAATLGWMRLLAESHARWGSAELLAELRATSDAFLSLAGADGLVPADTSLAILKPPLRQDPGATPTPKPSITPAPEIESIRPVICLADLDLYAMKLLHPLDERWQGVYARSLALVQDALLENPVPLFQYAYDPAIGGYIGFAGSQPVVGLEDSLLTLLHLYEAGETLPETLTWVRSRFYETSVLPEQVNRASGSAASEGECITGYAMLARVARLADDPMLYVRATERLAWHTASSQRSAAYGAIFRTEPDERFRVLARDNFWALLAYR